jgi:hypothetical protein
MIVRKLIEALGAMPQDAEVLHLWDGAPRTGIEHVWLARSGDVMTADDEMVAYDTDARPLDAPTAEEDEYWKTPRSGV